MVSTKTNFLNVAKRDKILELWCKENLLPKDFKEWQKQTVNYATLEDVSKLAFAGVKNYEDQIAGKKTKVISDQEIKLEKEYKFLRLIFFSSAHYFDIDNHQPPKNHDVFKAKLQNTNENVKTCVIFGGDLFGTEWKMKDFNNAKLVEDNGEQSLMVQNDEGNVVLYYGLNKRMKELEKDIRSALKSGADVYLMRGAEEHDIYQATGRNILKEVYERMIASTSEAIVPEKLHYINEAASLRVPFVREKSDGSIIYGDIGIQTNNTDKSATAQGSIRAADKSNGELNCGVRFVTNSNTVGAVGTTFYVSPQAKYARTPHKKKPKAISRDYDTFILSMEQEHSIQVREGDFVADPNAALMAEIHREKYKFQVLCEVAKSNIDGKLNELNNPYKGR